MSAYFDNQEQYFIYFPYEYFTYVHFTILEVLLVNAC